MTDQTRQINPNGTNHWLDPILASAEQARAQDAAPQCRAEDSTGQFCAGPAGHPSYHSNLNGSWPLPTDAQNRNYSDAELCATYAAEALEAGRYQLAVELSRLAVRAERYAAEQHPTPITINPPPGAVAARIEMFGPGADRVRNVPLIGRTRDESPRLDDRISHAPSVCTYRPYPDSLQTCHQPIAWADGVGESGIQRVPAGWYHLDPEITDHQPVAAGQ